VVLLRCDASSAEVQAGPLRMKVPLAEITAVLAGEPAKAAGGAGKRLGTSPGARPGGVTVHTAAAPDEINLIGCTVEEATRLVDKFLDTAALGGKSRVRVIHGHGTGALRRGLAEFFAAHPLVESMHAEEAERGGAAVTVVELKG
jgi:DNA mismatch repair protein MutS2